jgi:hypothetical protein
MSPTCRRLVLLTLFLAVLPMSSLAQEQRPAAPSSAATAPLPPAAAPGRLTGKERLGEKWNDEQRLDNCNVPPEKRGPVPRPDDCSTPTSH